MNPHEFKLFNDFLWGLVWFNAFLYFFYDYVKLVTGNFFKMQTLD